MAVSFMFDIFIKIQRATVVKDPDTGQQTETWEDLSRVHASETTGTTGNEKETDSQIVASQKVTFSIRHRSDLKKTDRIVYDGEQYDIITIVKIGRKKYMNVVCKLRDSSSTV